jgi:alpha-methylacyl-CoA racemase
MTSSSSGPLTGVRVLEIASLTPGPFACTLLSDLGAEVLRVDRLDADQSTLDAIRPLSRGRRSIAVDLKAADGVSAVLRLVEHADVLVEGFRPGVMERLGLGPDDCAQINHALIYARVTGWGQDGPLSRSAGHDINYIALAGALDPVGMSGERPIPAANMLGDLGGGGLVLALGVVAALYERNQSGQGQVVDGAIVDGAALLTAGVIGLRAAGRWTKGRGQNMADGGAPFYDTYLCADGTYLSVGAVEPQFFRALVAGLGLDEATLPAQWDESGWTVTRQLFAAHIAQHPQKYWVDVFAGTDACVTPVLTTDQAAVHPHLEARQTFVAVDGITQPAPAPRFSRTPGRVQGGAPAVGAHSRAALAEWAGCTEPQIEALLARGVIRQA